MPRSQFRLRSLFNVTAIAAFGCLVGPPIAREVRDGTWLHDFGFTLPALDRRDADN
jgi:hypothetical protein